MKYFKITSLILLSLLVISYAETPFTWGKEIVLARRIELIKQAREHVQDSGTQLSPTMQPDQKSVGKAVLFSALLPGAGEFYSNSYIKAAAFLAVEIGAWAVNISYHKKGDKKDSEFKLFADDNWNEYRYWSYVNWVAANDPNYEGTTYPYREVPAPDGGKWYLIEEYYYNNEREQVLATLRQVEADRFSHRLPSTKTQQYYEMIGKYPMQFGNAWSDANFEKIYSGPSNITSNNNYYMDMRDDANRLYDIAQYGAMTALINHVVSAIDAGFTARHYNRGHATVEMSYKNLQYKSEYINMLGVNVKW